MDYLNELKNCKTENEFKQLWNLEEYDCNNDWWLARYCSEYFNVWWDKDKFDWQFESITLAEYCTKHFNIWWNENKWDWNNHSWLLSTYCFEYFEIWWDEDKYDWNEFWALPRFCSKHIDIWRERYVIEKLKRNI